MATDPVTPRRNGRLQLFLPLLAAQLLALPLLAAGPQRGLQLEVAPQGPLLPTPPRPAPPALASPYQPAPLPNRDIDTPRGPRASNETTVSPSLFNRNDTYRGEGFAPGSSAAAEQDRKVLPGAGINLRMPFAPK